MTNIIVVPHPRDSFFRRRSVYTMPDKDLSTYDYDETLRKMTFTRLPFKPSLHDRNTIEDVVIHLWARVLRCRLVFNPDNDPTYGKKAPPNGTFMYDIRVVEVDGRKWKGRPVLATTAVRPD